MKLQGNKITLSDAQASAYFDSSWIEMVRDTTGSIFFDGHEVYPSYETNGPRDILVLTAVCENTNFEEIYG